MFGNIIFSPKVTGLINRSPTVFVTNSNNYILNRILLICYVMPVQRVLESSERISLLIATFWYISMFLSTFENL